MANQLPENTESRPYVSFAEQSRNGSSLQGKLDETIEIYDGLRQKYHLYSDFLPENVATKQIQLAKELNQQIEKRQLFIRGERLEIAGQTSTIRPTGHSDFYAISKNLAHSAFFEGRFAAAHVVPIPTEDNFNAMDNIKHEYAEWSSNRYGLTFMFDQMVVIIPSPDYPMTSDTVEVFPRNYTLIPVEYPGIELRSVTVAREEVMELFNGKDREGWTHIDDDPDAAEQGQEEANKV